MRQQLYNLFDPKSGCCVSSLAYEYPADYDVPLHAHATAQLIYAIRGVMEIAATGRLWVIPPQFAIWIPPRTEHRIHMPGAVSMRTLYFRRGVAALLPQTCCVLHMTPLIRELVIETVRLGSLRTRNRLHAALRDVLLAQLKNARPVPTSIPLPSDARALSAARAFMANPASGHSLSHVCLSAGASIRTMERLFRKDVGTSFESWRTQVRIMKGVELLAAGRTVKEAAFQVGYRQPSAFIEMFRRTLGATPKAWVSKLNQSV